MFDFIRTHQRLMQLVLLVLILPSFVLIGVSGYTNYVSGDHDIVTLAGTSITQQEFDQARRNQLQQLQQNSQGGFDPAILDNPAARSALLESLIDRRVLVETARKERFSVSDATLRQTIAAMPQLQVDGRFSAERYNEVLASAGLTTRDFEQSQRGELALNRVLGPVAATATVPAMVADQLKRALTEQRTVRLLAYPASEHENSITISDADIQAWYDANKQSLELPEQVSVQYLLLNEAAAMENLPEVSDEELQKYYEQNKARYVQPSRVNISHIQINIPAGATEAQRQEAHAKAEAVAAQAQADKAAFAELASKESQDAGTAKEGGKLGWITKGSWPANLEQVIFALGAGDVSKVVEGPGGYHIFQANEVQPEKGESFEEAKAKVQAEVQRQLGADRYADMATKLTSLVYDNPTSLQPAADELGLKVSSAAGITRDHLLASDEVPANAASSSADAALLDDVRVRRALFTPQVLNEKQNSGVIEISPDTMMVVRVDTVTPAHVPELAQVSDHITEQLKAERALAAAEQAGQAALAGFQQLDAAQVPDAFGTPLDISRIDPQGLDKSVADAAFSAPAGTLPVYTGVKGPQGYVVVRVEGVKQGETDNPLLASLPIELNQAWGQAEEQAVLQAMRTQAEVTLLPEAQQALSGDAEDRN
ncbi:SurA N-terminal domain-containing protein [Pusillimonas sp. SM2304]|uniref:SurA N-terminal domain-containing protein n=1 Tax=Pusillimonas sp. SM2304 TaxID=3073241 RepID=UPI0028745385|nr:SurA N-terminal domain-containing protein [Pusillimonas sp. SM2304]MDS1141452.1 SurA N-terminal domain-containing protein [Pusillimonas sp. SM2304]